MKVLSEEFFVPYGPSGRHQYTRLRAVDSHKAVAFQSLLDVDIEGTEYHVVKVSSPVDVLRWTAIDVIRMREFIRHEMREQLLREIGKILFPNA